MALIVDPDNLSQGKSTTLSLTFSTKTGADITIAGTGIENLAPQYSYFEIRNANLAKNNGLYWVKTTGTNTLDATKVAGDSDNDPQNDSANNADILHDDGVAADEKSVYIDFYNREIWLLKQGSLDNDGVTLQTLYSFCKEEWKDDPLLIPHPFPFVAITPEQFEVDDGWIMHEGVDASGDGTNDVVQDIETAKLIRTGGWRQIGTDSNLNKEYAGVITLGDFEDNTNDGAYYEQGTDATLNNSTNFTFNGPVNEAVLTYDRATLGPFTGTELAITGNNTITRSDAGGNFLTEGYLVGGQITILTSDESANVGTYTITSVSSTVIVVSGTPLTNDTGDLTFTAAVNNRNVLNVFIRSGYLFQGGDTSGKTYGKSNLSAIGVTAVDNKVFRFPLSSALDLKITTNDTDIASPVNFDSGVGNYNDIYIRYFDQDYSRDVDLTGTPRNFGIVIDVGTHSGVDGSSAASTTFTSTEGGITAQGANVFDGGILRIHEGTDKGDHTISSTTATTVVLSSALTASESNLSFTLIRPTPVQATAEEIYEKVQYELRQTGDIDDTDQTVVGRTADALLTFVGDDLIAGTNVDANPRNPNYAAGTGVIIEGFLANDTNRLKFFDNLEIQRTFPFVAAGTISFNQNLIDEANGAAKFWMFYRYTTRTITTNAVTLTASGSQATFTTTSGAVNLPSLGAKIGEYISVTGFSTNDVNNGIYRVVSFTDATTGGFVADKADGQTLVTETSSGLDITFDNNPIDSASAIIVQDNSDTNISTTIDGASSYAFDYDYDNNTQGGRTADTDAAIIIRAIGTDDAQFVETTGTITKNTGLTFSLVAALERNYDNPV